MSPERLFATHRRAMTTALFCVAIMVGSFGLAAYSLVVAHDASCRGRDRLLNVVHDIIQTGQPTRAEFLRMSRAKQERVARFYDSAYRKIDQARC